MIYRNSSAFSGAKCAFVESYDRFYPQDLRSFEIVNSRGSSLLCQTLLNLVYKCSNLLEATSLISELTTISREVKCLAEGMLKL